jgi:hypothetical protein
MKRLTAMRQQTKKVRLWRLGSLCAVCISLVVIFACTEEPSYPYRITVGEVQPINQTFKVNANYNSGEWSGTVYDEEGGGLPGVNIIVPGTTVGTVSDLNGSFKLPNAASADIQLSFVGYETVKLTRK